jgi:hypothetical protein
METPDRVSSTKVPPPVDTMSSPRGDGNVGAFNHSLGMKKIVDTISSPRGDGNHKAKSFTRPHLNSG